MTNFNEGMLRLKVGVKVTINSHTNTRILVFEESCYELRILLRACDPVEGVPCYKLRYPFMSFGDHLDSTAIFLIDLNMACEDNKRINDGCDRRCKCEDGELVSCYRVRKEFTRMSFEERKRFIQAVKLASSDPRYKSEYEKLTTFHSRVPSTFLHHMPQIFLPWHRWFMLKFENFLRRIDCRITIPYWDWSKDAEHWTRGSEIRDVWNPGLHGLGGNGVSPDKCVMDGPFKESEFSLPRSAGGGYLKRDFNFSVFCNLPNGEDAQRLVKLEDFAVFEEKIREIFHAKFHDCVSEHMCHICYQTFASTPEFWLHYSFLDKLWVDWQNKGNANKFPVLPKH